MYLTRIFGHFEKNVTHLTINYFLKLCLYNQNFWGLWMKCNMFYHKWADWSSISSDLGSKSRMMIFVFSHSLLRKHASCSEESTAFTQGLWTVSIVLDRHPSGAGHVILRRGASYNWWWFLLFFHRVKFILLKGWRLCSFNLGFSAISK